MDIVTIIGLTAAALTTTGFLPQVLKTWRLKETKDISLIMYLLISTGILLWLIYGLLIRDIPIIAANAVSLIFAFAMIFFKLRYG